MKEEPAVPHRILVVEDEPAIADTITYALQTEGYEVEWCATAREAARRFEAAGCDLIVLDVGLPDGSGFDWCREVRRHSAVPIIFLTARANEIDRVVGLEIGGDDYIPKPFSPRELAARVRAVLRRAHSAEAKPSGTADRFDLSDAARNPVRFPFCIDAERMRITYFGRPVELSRYEYRLLEVLIRRPGRVYSREKLMELAWDAPESSTDRTVDAHIKTLRAKLRQMKPDIDPILTHRGVGYSLKDEW
jgi:two-component system catabolic regulation response regulator CreB